MTSQAFGRSVVMAALQLLLAGSLIAADNAPQKQTVAEYLEKRAGEQWEAAHDPQRPGRTPEQVAVIRKLFDTIETLTLSKSLAPQALAKMLQLSPDFTVTHENEYFTTYEAELVSGTIRHIETRVSATNTARGLVILTVDRDLGITPGEIIDHFGSAGILSPSIHSPPDATYAYVYSRPEGQLRLGIRPGKIHLFESIVWDTIESQRKGE